MPFLIPEKIHTWYDLWTVVAEVFEEAHRHLRAHNKLSLYFEIENDDIGCTYSPDAMCEVISILQRRKVITTALYLAAGRGIALYADPTTTSIYYWDIAEWPTRDEYRGHDERMWAALFLRELGLHETLTLWRKLS